MTDPKTERFETLVVVERQGIHRIEIREVVREGDSCYVIFRRSDNSEARVAIDATKLKNTVNGRVPADLIYTGGSLTAPQQEV